MTEIRTFCRLCEANCGLVAELDESGALAKLRPDKEHPVTRGFACNKGLLGADVHHDPDRVNEPLRRNPDGTFEPITWEKAVSEIAEKTRAIRERHGPRALSGYLGNPNAFNALGGSSIAMFLFSQGSDRLYSAGTQDCANKYATSEILYGSSGLHPVADIDHTDHLLLIGTNPRVSKMSFLSLVDPVRALRDVVARGATVRFVNPLRVEDESDIGETVQILPDTDLYLLAAMLHEIDAGPGFDEAALEAHGKNAGELRAFVARYPADRVAAVVGIDAERIRTMAREFHAAPTAAVHMSTGVNMGRQGAMAYWLVQMLSLVTGNFDRRGGNFVPARGMPPLPNMCGITQEDFVAEPGGRFRPANSLHPAGLMEDLIQDPDEPIRALFISSGNPVLSVGGGESLREAFEALELLVCIDLYRNATGQLADYVLPATDAFEREDLNYFVQGTQRHPYVQWTDRVVEPQHQRREEWWALARIAQELGLPSHLDTPDADPMASMMDGGLASVGLSIDQLRETEGGVAVLPEIQPGGFFENQIMTEDHRVDCFPEIFAEGAERVEWIFEDLCNEARGFRLITRRTAHTINSTLQNVERLKTAKGAATNPLYMNPDDMAEKGLVEGQKVQVENQHGSLTSSLRAEPDLRRGVVAMTHGFGNARVPGMRIAQKFPGVNVNVLSPSGWDGIDPLSGMSQLTGIPVDVEAAGLP